MSTVATISKGTHAIKKVSAPSQSGSSNVVRLTIRTPLVIMTVLAVTLALCATTQVLASKLNRTILPPLSLLSLDDALAYLSTRTFGDEVLDENYSPSYSNATTRIQRPSNPVYGPAPATESYALLMANNFLGYFFDELETGLGEVR